MPYPIINSKSPHKRLLTVTPEKRPINPPNTRHARTPISQTLPLKPTTSTNINWSYKIKPSSKSQAQTYLNTARLLVIEKIIKQTTKPIPSFHAQINQRTGELLPKPLSPFTFPFTTKQEKPYQQSSPRPRPLPTPETAMILKRRKYIKSVKENVGAHQALMRRYLRVMWRTTPSRLGQRTEKTKEVKLRMRKWRSDLGLGRELL